MFERIEGCWACTNPAGIPIPVSEFPQGGDIALCNRHWNWWVLHFAVEPVLDVEPPCSAHLLGTRPTDRQVEL